MAEWAPAELGEEFRFLFPRDDELPVVIYWYMTGSSSSRVIRGLTVDPTPVFCEMGADEYEIRSIWTVPSARHWDGYLSSSSSDHSLRDQILTYHLKSLQIPPEGQEIFPSIPGSRPDRLSSGVFDSLKRIHTDLCDTLYTKFLSEACLIV